MAKVIPGLRPWEVLSVEQAMDEITYGGEWYREPLGTYTTGPPYIRHWNKDVKVGCNLLRVRCWSSCKSDNKTIYPAFNLY